jgi:ecdysteroid 25-hydroxylase CYP302A1
MTVEVEKLFLELMCLITFDRRLQSFSESGRDPNSVSSKLIKAGDVTNKLILPLDQGFQLWRLFETKQYKALREAQECMQSIALNFINQHKQKISNGDALLDQYLKNPKIDKRDIVGMSCDVLLASVHTTSYSTGFALYHIAKNKHVQDLMYEEAKKVLPNENDEITSQIMNTEIPYTRAVLKETFRLNPISIGIGRILNHDTIFSGYLVPKNVNFFF